MPCPRWSSTATTRRQRRTALGDPRFNCRACGRRFHERTGPPFNDRQDPTDLVRRAVLGRLRSTLRFRAVVALLLQRGDAVTPEPIRNWACRCAPLLADPFRAKRRGQAGGSWYLDETSGNVAGRWCSRYRALDREGVLLDSRRMGAARTGTSIQRGVRRAEEASASGDLPGGSNQGPTGTDPLRDLRHPRAGHVPQVQRLRHPLIPASVGERTPAATAISARSTLSSKTAP